MDTTTIQQLPIVTDDDPLTAWPDILRQLAESIDGSLPRVLTGSVIVTPVADTQVSQHVKFLPDYFRDPGLEPAFGPIRIVVGLASGAAGGTNVQVGVGAGVDQNGFDVLLQRSNTTPTRVNWQAIQLPAGYDQEGPGA